MHARSRCGLRRYAADSATAGVFAAVAKTAWPLGFLLPCGAGASLRTVVVRNSRFTPAGDVPMFSIVRMFDRQHHARMKLAGLAAILLHLRRDRSSADDVIRLVASASQWVKLLMFATFALLFVAVLGILIHSYYLAVKHGRAWGFGMLGEHKPNATDANTSQHTVSSVASTGKSNGGSSNPAEAVLSQHINSKPTLMFLHFALQFRQASSPVEKKTIEGSMPIRFSPMGFPFACDHIER